MILPEEHDGTLIELWRIDDDGLQRRSNGELSRPSRTMLRCKKRFRSRTVPLAISSRQGFAAARHRVVAGAPSGGLAAALSF